MDFKEWLLIQEMGYVSDPKDENGRATAVPLPPISVNPNNIRVVGTVPCTFIDMRFEDYGFKASNYVPWYAELPNGQILSSYESDSRIHQNQKSFQQYRNEMDQRQQKPILWMPVPKQPTASAQAQDVHGMDNKPRPWWDFAEGGNGNTPSKFGLYRVVQNLKANSISEPKAKTA